MKEVKQAIVLLRSRAKQLERVAQVLSHLDSFTHIHKPSHRTRKAKRVISVATRRKMRKAQQARWKRVRNGKLKLVKKAA